MQCWGTRQDSQRSTTQSITQRFLPLHRLQQSPAIPRPGPMYSPLTRAAAAREPAYAWPALKQRAVLADGPRRARTTPLPARPDLLGLHAVCMAQFRHGPVPSVSRRSRRRRRRATKPWVRRAQSTLNLQVLHHELPKRRRVAWHSFNTERFTQLRAVATEKDERGQARHAQLRRELRLRIAV